MSRDHKTWLVLLACVTAGIIERQWTREAPRAVAAPAGADALDLLVAGKLAVGLHELQVLADREDPDALDQVIDRMKELEETDTDRVRRAIVEAEVRGAKPALLVLDALSEETPDRDVLRRRYAGESLGDDEQDALVRQYGWFGRLSGAYAVEDDEPARRAILDGARHAAVAYFTLTASLIPGILVGTVLFIIFIIRVTQRRVQARFALHDEGAGDLVWLQTVVIGLTIMLALMMGLFENVPIHPQLKAWLVGLAFLWPLVRGVRVREWALGLGLAGGRGLLRELGAGVVGYVGGLPIIALGFWLTMMLSNVTGLEADHPLRHAVSGPRAQPVWSIVLSGVVWAPVIEELLFRGAFYRYLRPSLSVVGSSVLTGLLFAALHPQGLAGIPVILCIAIVFAALREWRGAIYASMGAHALHNGLIVIVTVFLLR